MIDIGALRAAAEKDDGTDAVVERSWLKEVLAEISEARAAKARLGCFGIAPGVSL